MIQLLKAGGGSYMHFYVYSGILFFLIVYPLIEKSKMAAKMITVINIVLYIFNFTAHRKSTFISTSTFFKAINKLMNV